MIKTSELRPGNIVQYARPMKMENYDGSPSNAPFRTLYGVVDSVRVGQSRILPKIPPLEEISLDGFVGVVHPKMLAGVPLTPELLYKIGFDGDDISWTIKPMIFPIFKRNDGLFFLFREDCHGPLTGKPILYLHQLQNLCFAMTGEELTIKL